MNSEFFGAVDIFGYGNSISEICISDNKISGSAASAFNITSFEFLGLPPSDISNISISNNKIEDYETTCSAGVFHGSPLGCVDVFFGATTHDLTFCGEAGIAIDNGIDNTFTEDNCPECQ